MCPSKMFISNPLSKILRHFVLRFFPRLRTTNNFIKYSKKGKAVPLQALRGPEGSRKLRFLDLVKTAQDGGKVIT